MYETTAVVDLDPLALLARDRELAERAMNRLPLREQLRLVLSAPFDRRETLLSLSQQAGALIRALPPQEFWLTVKAIGTGEATALLREASPDQVQCCLDLDCWRKDAWQSEPTLQWCTAIGLCGDAKIHEWWSQGDPDFLVLLLKRWVTVYLRSGDEIVADVIPWPRPEPPFTVDNMYFFQCNDAAVDRILRPMFEALARSDLPRLRHLFDAMLGVGASEQEEEAYAVRERRLAEIGFPGWDEAIAVYARVPESRWTALRRTTGRGTPAAEVHPQFPLAPLQHGTLLLKDVLGSVDDPELVEGFLLEMSRLANRVVVADGHPITPTTVLQATVKALGYVNIGLELVSGSEYPAGVRALREYWAVALFQIGYSAVTEIAERARAAWAPFAAAPENIPDDPEVAIPHERVRAAAWKWPKYYLGPASPDGVLHRDFQGLADLASVQTALQVFP